jgi:hypothetical protein
MSLSASDASYSRIPPSGKTPPPAPSAAYAKRSLFSHSALFSSLISYPGQGSCNLKACQLDIALQPCVRSPAALLPTTFLPTLPPSMPPLCHHPTTLLDFGGPGLGPCPLMYSLLPNDLRQHQPLSEARLPPPSLC